MGVVNAMKPYYGIFGHIYKKPTAGGVLVLPACAL